MTAAAQSAARTLSAATWSETTADEHAVSIDSHAPCRPRLYERRPAAIEMVPPVAA